MARGLNKVMLIERLGKDPEVRHTQNGMAVANFSIATSETWTDKATNEKKERTEWHRIVAFGKLGEICDQYFQNGNGQQCPADCQLRHKKMTDPVSAPIIPVDPDVRQKTCKVCDQEKPIDDFPKNARSKDGHLNTYTICFGERISKSHSKKAEEEIKPKPKESKPAK